MSADNYYHVTRHPKGGYAVVMGFLSDDEPDLVADDTADQFTRFEDALEWADEQYAEYGVSIDRDIADERALYQLLCSLGMEELALLVGGEELALLLGGEQVV